jgi:hypothetical protein
MVGATGQRIKSIHTQQVLYLHTPILSMIMTGVMQRIFRFYTERASRLFGVFDLKLGYSHTINTFQDTMHATVMLKSF